MLYNANHDGVVHFDHCLCVPKAVSNIKRESHSGWWHRLVLFVQLGLRQNMGTDEYVPHHPQSLLCMDPMGSCAETVTD